MQQQKFDSSKPHGIVYNHAYANYEQDGVLFDSGGDPVEPEDDVVQEQGEISSDAAEYLKKALSGGAVRQEVLHKQSQIDGLNWSEIVKASSILQVKKYKFQMKDTWKLS